MQLANEAGANHAPVPCKHIGKMVFDVQTVFRRECRILFRKDRPSTCKSAKRTAGLSASDATLFAMAATGQMASDRLSQTCVPMHAYLV